MSVASALFDQNLIRSRLKRALSGQPADFLLQRAVVDLEDRLSAVLRTFDQVLDLGTPLPIAARSLLGTGRVKSVLRASPIQDCLQSDLFQEIIADISFLPLADASFNAAVSLYALQTVDDLPGALIQARRALKPDGLFIGCMLGGATLHELRQCMAEAEALVEGGASPHVAPFADLRDMGGLLQRAGFALPVTDSETVTVRYEHPLALMHDLRAMGATNPLIARRRSPMRRATLLRAIELYSERFSDPDGRIRATFETLWLSGWAPDPSQQKPLKPGSASKRLADALGVAELKAGEKPGP
jgi:SAM-dependent methyltransferase